MKELLKHLRLDNGWRWHNGAAPREAEKTLWEGVRGRGERSASPREPP